MQIRGRPKFARAYVREWMGSMRRADISGCVFARGGRRCLPMRGVDMSAALPPEWHPCQLPTQAISTASTHAGGGGWKCGLVRGIEYCAQLALTHIM
eukprot:8081604-Pyramimonas_sp.AAC.1